MAAWYTRPTEEWIIGGIRLAKEGLRSVSSEGVEELWEHLEENAQNIVRRFPENSLFFKSFDSPSRQVITQHNPDFLTALTLELAQRPQPLLKPFYRFLDSLHDVHKRNPLRSFLNAVWLYTVSPTPTVILPTVWKSFHPQNSPCCAASSLAGALCCVLGQESLCEEKDVINALDDELLEKINSSIKLCQPSVRLELTKLLEIVQRLQVDLSPPAGRLYEPPPSTNSHKQLCLQEVCCLLSSVYPEVDWQALPVFTPYTRAKSVSVDRLSRAASPPRRSSCSDEHLPRLNTFPFVSLVSQSDPVETTSSRKTLRESTLCDLVYDIWGLAKLRCASPSTARFGSWSISRALKQLQLRSSVYHNVDCQLFNLDRMSFDAFVRISTNRQSCSILHLPNHYALVFGFELLNNEVLTSRRGQAPNNWVSWSELQSLQRKSKEPILAVIQLLSKCNQKRWK